MANLGGLAGAVYNMGQTMRQDYLLDLQNKKEMQDHALDTLTNWATNPGLEPGAQQEAQQLLLQAQQTPLHQFKPDKISKAMGEIISNSMGRQMQAKQPNPGAGQMQPGAQPQGGASQPGAPQPGSMNTPAMPPNPPQGAMDPNMAAQMGPEMATLAADTAQAASPQIGQATPFEQAPMPPRFFDPNRIVQGQVAAQTALNVPKFAEYAAQANAMQDAERKRREDEAEFNKKLERDKLKQTRDYLQSNTDPATGKSLYDSLDPFVKAELETGKNIRPEPKGRTPIEFGTTDMLKIQGQDKPVLAFLDKNSGTWLDMSHNPIDPKTILGKVTASETPKNDFEQFWLPNFAKGLGKTVAQLTPDENKQAFREYKQDPEAAAAAASSRNLSDALKQMQLSQMPTPEQAKQVASDMVSHRIAPEQLASMFGASGQNFKRMVYTEAKKLDPAFDFEQAAAEYGLVKSPQFQNTIRYMDSVQSSIPLVIKRANELGNSKVRFVNGLANLGRDQINDPKLKKFQTDALLVADEIAKILQGGGTGNGTSDAKLNQAAQIIKASDSPQAIAAGLADVQELMSYRRKSLTHGTYMENQKSFDTSAPPNPPTAGAKGDPLGIR